MEAGHPCGRGTWQCLATEGMITPEERRKATYREVLETKDREETRREQPDGEEQRDRDTLIAFARKKPGEGRGKRSAFFSELGGGRKRGREGGISSIRTRIWPTLEKKGERTGRGRRKQRRSQVGSKSICYIIGGGTTRVLRRLTVTEGGERREGA